MTNSHDRVTFENKNINVQYRHRTVLINCRAFKSTEVIRN